MEPILEEKCEMKVLAISNTQTVIADKNKVIKESEATNAEKKVKLCHIFLTNFTLCICCIYVYSHTFLQILFIFLNKNYMRYLYMILIFY